MIQMITIKIRTTKIMMLAIEISDTNMVTQSIIIIITIKTRIRIKKMMLATENMVTKNMIIVITMKIRIRI